MTKEERIRQMINNYESVNMQMAQERGSGQYISPYSDDIKDYVRHIECEDSKYINESGVTSGDLHFAEKFYAGKIQLNSVLSADWSDEAEVNFDVLNSVGIHNYDSAYKVQHEIYIEMHKHRG